MGGADNDLTTAERTLYERTILGDPAVYAWDEPIDSRSGASWSSGRIIRAEKLAALVRGEVPALSVHWRGVRIRGARITGLLDLESATVRYPLELIDCYLEKPVRLIDAQTQRVLLRGSCVAGIDADGARIRGDLCLGQGFESLRTVSIVGATIDGNLDCRGGEFRGGPCAVDAYRAAVAGSVRLGVIEIAGEPQRFAASGTVSLIRATIGGDLDCDGGQFRGETDAIALHADRVGVAGAVHLGVTEMAGKPQRFAASGIVSLIQATVGGDLDCDGGQFGGRADATSLRATRAKVSGTVYLGVTVSAGEPQRFVASGTVSLIQVRVGGDLDCRGGDFRGTAKASLVADKADVTGTVRLGAAEAANQAQPFDAAEEVSLIQAKIGGELDWRLSRVA
jgi:hypothetical protein